MLGALPGTLKLVDGGVGPQTVQTLRNIEAILDACGCSLADVAKVNVYMTDMAKFQEMNDAYLRVFGSDPPARFATGCTALALGAAIEMDCIAFVPDV
jgi:enamine deaminase RidA (YjgF/YER057c/UK114 family)